MAIYKNNFDTSTTGINIEFMGCYDSHIAMHEWQENFKSINDNVYFYTDYGQLNFNDITFRIKGTIHEKRKYIRDNHQSIKLKANEVEYDLLFCIGHDLLDLYCDKDNIFNGYKLEIVPSTPLTAVTVRGYSQGDTATVYYSPAMFKKLWGKAPIESELRKDFTHYFRDSPILATLTINGSEYYYNLNPYDWQRAEWLASVSQAAAIPLETLENIVPKELDHA